MDLLWHLKLHALDIQLYDDGEIDVTDCYGNSSIITQEQVRSLYETLDKYYKEKEHREYIESLKGTSKICPVCECTEMIPLHSDDKKKCSNCGLEIDWDLSADQKRTFE